MRWGFCILQDKIHLSFKQVEVLHLKKYILLSAHREENIDIDQNFFSLMNAVNMMAETYNMPVLYSCHPRSQKMIEQRGFKFNEMVIPANE